jgi:hypothetical protein
LKKTRTRRDDVPSYLSGHNKKALVDLVRRC